MMRANLQDDGHPFPADYESTHMDGLLELLPNLQIAGHLQKHLRGVFHVCIGRRITLKNDTIISTGITWRALAKLLTELKIEPEVVAQLGVDPEDLSPRERPRFWYSAIAIAKPDSPAARTEAEHVIASMKLLGYVVGPAPAPSTTLSTPVSSTPIKKVKKPVEDEESDEPLPKKKKPR